MTRMGDARDPGLLSALRRVLDREQSIFSTSPDLSRGHLRNMLSLYEGSLGTVQALLESSAAGVDASRPWMELTNQPEGFGSSPLVRKTQESSQVNAVCWSPDGSRYAVGFHGAVLVAESDSGRVEHHIPFGGEYGYAVRMAWSPDGNRIAIATTGAAVVVWHAQRDEVELLGHTGPFHGVAWSPDGGHLATASRDRTVGIWKADRPGPHTKFELYGRLVLDESVPFSVDWSPDARLVATGDDRGTIDVFDLEEQAVLRSFDGRGGGIRSLAFSPDGSAIAAAGADGGVSVWSLEDSGRVSLAGHAERATAVSWHPAGKLLASGGWDRRILVSDNDTAEPVAEFEGHDNWVLDLAWSPDGTRLLSGGADGTRLWDASRARRDIPPHSFGDVAAGAWSPNRAILASAGGPDDRGEHSVGLWDGASGRAIGYLDGHEDLVTQLAFSPDGEAIASSSRDMTVRVWSVAAEPPAEIQMIRAPSWRMGWIETGLLVAAEATRRSTGDQVIAIADVVAGRMLSTIDAYGPTLLAWSADGRMLAAADDKDVVLFDVSGGRRTMLGAAASPANVAAWSPDGRYLATAGGRQTMDIMRSMGSSFTVTTKAGRVLSGLEHVRTMAMKEAEIAIWDTIDPGEPRRLRGHTEPVMCLAWSPDGTMLASGGVDRAVRIWDVENELCLAAAHIRSFVLAVAFSTDGRLLSVADDGASTGNRPTPYIYRLHT